MTPAPTPEGIQPHVSGRLPYSRPDHRPIDAATLEGRGGHPLTGRAVPQFGSNRSLSVPQNHQCEVEKTITRAAGDVVIGERLAEDVADAQARVERGVRVLERHLEPASVGAHSANWRTRRVAWCFRSYARSCGVTI
jgi:hypothetical protein